MISYKTQEEIELIRESSLLVSKTLGEVARNIEPGVPTKKLDEIAEEFIKDNQGVPAFKGYKGFPYTLCISVNEVIVHGFPGSYELQDTDIISVDCGVVKNKFFGDCAYTFALAGILPDVEKLLITTKTALHKGISKAVPGNRMGDLAYAIQHEVEVLNGYSIVRELVGHGIGKNLHEEPEVPNYGRRGAGIKLQDGLVIAIEPMVNLGKRNIAQGKDGWTIFTRDKTASAHYEHTVLVRKGGADILSSHEFAEKMEKSNPNLKEIIQKS